ncbi:MAG: hypothetical protein ABI183_01945 [Polyangiaceae bacterium]
MNRIARLACFSAVSCALFACSTDSSSGRPTNQIQPNFSVTVDTASPGSTYIGAILGEPGDGDFDNVQLSGGDTLIAKTDKDASIALPYDSTLQAYSTTLEKVIDRKTVTFVLTRANGGSAPNSTVTLPDAVAVTSPAANAKVSAASGNVQIAWSNPLATGKMQYVAYPCGSAATTTNTESSSDTGSFSFPVSSIISGAPTAAGQCITIQINRQVPGTFDPAFDQGGTFSADRFDYVNFLLTP